MLADKLAISWPVQPRMEGFIYQDQSFWPAQVLLDARFEDDFKENYKELKSAFERLKILKVHALHHTNPMAVPHCVVL